MKSPLLSASLIVKNEEKFLGPCLDSLRDVADEVVVVDTGSTDRTKEIAADAGARVIEFPWTGDFSAARNYGLGLCTGEWILYIDADERVRSGSTSDLRSELSSTSHVAYEVLLHPRRGFTSFWIIRLFRNAPSIRFRGVIHENLWPAVQEYRARHGGDVGHSTLVLDHDGYEDVREPKNARNLPLLLESVRENPRRVYSWCHLADIYTDTGEHQLAEEAWTRALEVVRARRAPVPEDVLPYVGLIHRGTELGRDIRALLEEARSRFPTNLNLEWLRGRNLMRDNKFEEAIAIFKRLIECGKTGDFDHLVAYDLRLFHLYSYDALAVCYFRLGRFVESRQYYQLAAEQAPESLEHRAKLALCSRLAAHPTTPAARR